MITTANCQDLLSKLVSCPSVNPNGRTDTCAPYCEERFAALLESLVKPWGAKVSLPEVWPHRPNFIATFKGRNSKRSLLLEAHADTVMPDPSDANPFTPVLRDGRLYGRGTCDTKGALASILLGLKEVLDQDGAFPLTIHLVSTADEELGASGAHALMKSGFRADLAVVGEPTGLQIVHSHKGVVRFQITAHGVAAHSSDPSKGVNAIYKMIPVLEAIESKVQPLLAAMQHPLLGKPALTVGTIRGGTQVNVVPAECTIEIDRRILPNETRDSARSQILQAISSIKDIDCADGAYYPPMEQAPDSAAVRLVADSCRRQLGKAELVGAPWASNAGVFAAAGIPSVLFGPGSIAQAHTKGEYIELEQVRQAALVYADIIRSAE